MPSTAWARPAVIEPQRLDSTAAGTVRSSGAPYVASPPLHSPVASLIVSSYSNGKVIDGSSTLATTL
jgi:hypothetical protein